MEGTAAAEGWYEDPYGLHGHRWFSDGVPTGLVKDGGVESTDPPPDGAVPGPLVPERPPSTPAPVGWTSSGPTGGPTDAEREADGPWDTMPQAFPVD